MNNTHKPKQGLEKRIQCVCFTLLLALLVVTGSSVLALASDVTNALWRGGVTITNTGTATTVVSVNMSLNSASFIENGYAAADLTDTAMQINGVDTAFMPSVNSPYPWVIFVSSIGAGQNINYDLYSGGVTGGKIRYFPSTGGMTTSDNNTSLELSDNFTIEQKVWVDTSATSVNISQAQQDGGVALYTAVRTRAAQRYNSFPATIITLTGFYLKKAGSPTGTAYARIRAVSDDSILGTLGTIDVSTLTTSQVWYVFNTNTVTIPTSQDIRITIEYTGGDAANYIFPAHNTSDVGNGVESLYDGSWTDYGSQDFTYIITNNRRIIYKEASFRTYISGTGNITSEIYGGSSVTAPGISSGEHIIKTTADSANLSIYIDGGLKNSIALGGVSVPDTSANWTFLQNVSTPYMEYQKIWVGGVLQQHIEWEYDTTFTDLSGKSHDAFPTFRTSSSDADVSAELTSFEPADQAELDTFSLVSSLEILTANATLPSEMYSELDVSRIPGGEAVTELLTEGGIPQSAWWFPFLYLGICVVGLIMYGATTLGRSGLGGKLAEGQVDGSLLVMFIVMEIPLAMLGIMGVTPFWPAILFPIAGVAIIISRKHYSWG